MPGTVNLKSHKAYSDLMFECFEDISKITINRPEVCNAFRPKTVIQMTEAQEKNVFLEKRDPEFKKLTCLL